MRAKLELKEFEAAKLYMDLRRYPSAIRSFDNLLIEFPETKRAEEIRYFIAKCAYESARGSFVELQKERYEECKERCDFFQRRYPESRFNKEVNDFLEQSKNRLNELQDGRYQSQSARS
ncbi:MAG: outer membrane protein assembly factor BamD, partial [Bacteroidota bacterium]